MDLDSVYDVLSGNCHENVTQVAENGGKSEAIDNK
jgi:hypothetical protein